MKEVWTCLASLMGAYAFLQTLIHAVLPPGIHSALSRLLSRLLRSFSSDCLFDIAETDGVSTNELYSSVQLYLSTSASVSPSRLSLSRPSNASSFTFSLSASADRLLDSFRGSTATWDHLVLPRLHSPPSFSWRPLPDERRAFTLRISKKDKPLILAPYLDHIMDRAADLRRRNQDRLLYTNSRGGGGGSIDGRGFPWESVPFKHPSTFDTLAMDPSRKEEIMSDLRDFAEGRGFYQRTGRAWKRGYLLYGPPGTGKSSMIAAMANFLGYDIYDLELTEVASNSELRKLLMKTTSKSIIVIEDIDCSISLANRAEPGNNGKRGGGPHASDPMMNEELGGGGNGKAMTLSGLLNFTDGLWSCCGSERIFVFTTNHVEKLDPALLRSGRMDMHIFMSYCTWPALKILMRNYLNVGEDGDDDGGGVGGEVVRELEEVVEKAKMTPADVSEVLIKKRRYEKGRAVRELLEVLKGRAERLNGGGGGGGDEEQEKRAVEITEREEVVEDRIGKVEERMRID